MIVITDFSYRFPLYRLLDCSGSTRGKHVEVIRHNIKFLLSNLKNAQYVGTESEGALALLTHLKALYDYDDFNL